MRKSTFLLLTAAATLAGCGQDADGDTAKAGNSAASVAAKAKKVPYCFFKDENAKGWTVAVDRQGDVKVKGEGYVADARYKAGLGKPEIDGTSARVQLTMPQNDTGFASPDGWWDVTTTISGSSNVSQVVVLCGAKTVADMEVPRKGRDPR